MKNKKMRKRKKVSSENQVWPLTEIDPHNPVHYIGAKYVETRHLDVKDVAKLIRNDIKTEIKKEKLPQGKYSIKIARFPGGQAIDAEITLPDTSEIREMGSTVVNSIENIINQFNYDHGDPRVDYHASRFYSHVSLEYEKI